MQPPPLGLGLLLPPLGLGLLLPPLGLGLILPPLGLGLLLLLPPHQLLQQQVLHGLDVRLGG